MPSKDWDLWLTIHATAKARFRSAEGFRGRGLLEIGRPPGPQQSFSERFLYSEACKMGVMFRSVAYDRSPVPDLVVRALFEGESAPVTWEPEVAEAVLRREFSAKAGQLTEAFPTNAPRTLVVGLGEHETFSLEAFRKVSSVTITATASFTQIPSS